jgi:hypothetical protein
MSASCNAGSSPCCSRLIFANTPGSVYRARSSQGPPLALLSLDSQSVCLHATSEFLHESLLDHEGTAEPGRIGTVQSDPLPGALPEQRDAALERYVHVRSLRVRDFGGLGFLVARETYILIGVAFRRIVARVLADTRLELTAFDTAIAF